ncbi:cyclic nucleotide-binding domain protein (macronuclear) [Tetrahymena thermophila SB210]|uniref:Cyclic nucleotide-binding domain protein n=1 Tax=Tetrahymena thermophila (strain SB210) TaxID=312017 RepID=I7M6G3_TETTS|nr:cyclic nucleotide-binding domain protein [Tetrahymena thermophila SB210]EAR85152.2 cyclic nucleotide-binding domain protein [Tetrahymena thermophila SB210]|eukprot:XP_001032815.2 cyclic nucleotide-binding domain protein [Tetrahymena thermophila SB210]
MIKQQAQALFDKQDHVLLQQISTRRESQENIQPISITDIDITAQDSSQMHKQNRRNTKGTSGGDDDDSQQNNYSQNNNSIIMLDHKLKEEKDNQSKETQAQNQIMNTSSLLSKQMRAVAQTQSQFKNITQDKYSEISIIKSEIESSFQNGEKVFINKRNLSHSRRLLPMEQKFTIQSSKFLVSKAKSSKSSEDIFMLIKKSVKQKIVKVLNYLLEKTENRRFKSLNQNQIQLINDKSYVLSQKEEKTNKKVKCFSLLQWKIISSTFQLKQIFKRLCDIVTKFFVGIYSKGDIVIDRSLIFKSYVKSYFFIDFSSALILLINILSLFDSYKYSAIFKSIFFIRILSSYQTFLQIDHLIHIVGKAGNLYELFKLMLKCILLCHIISILLYQLAIVEQTYFNVTNTWIDSIGIDNALWYDKYIYALYYSLNIIMLNPQNQLNTLETAFVILAMYSTIGSFALIMQCISDILEQENKKTREFKADLDTINQYMRKKNLKKELQSKVCNFLEYLYEEKGDIKNNKEALNVLKRLPVSLREDIQQDINQNVIEQFQSICKTFSDKIKKKTIQIIEEECFLPNEIIFKQGSFTNQALYLVQKGKVLLEKVKANGEIVTFCVLEKNGIFGETNFFSGLEFNYQVRSGDFTTVYKIPRKQFIEVIQTSNDDFEQFCVTRDSILIQKNSPFLQVCCRICNSNYHQENDCDKIHFSPNNYLIIQKQQVNFQQERATYQRQLRLRTNAIHFVNQMRDVCDRLNQNPDYITLIELLELDNLNQSNGESESSFHSDRDSNLDELDDSLSLNQAEQQIQEELELEMQKLSDSNSNQNKIYKIHSNFIDNNFIQEVEEIQEESPQQQVQKSLTVLDLISSGDQYSLSQISGSHLHNQNLNLQNTNSSYLNLNNPSINKFQQVQKINQVAQQFSHLINQNPTALTSQSQTKIIFQNSRSQFASYNDIFKSNTINSQATKKSKVQFDDQSVLEQQKSSFKRRNVKKKGLIPKSITKHDTRSLNEQKTSQSKKQNSKNEIENTNNIMQQGGIIKQLSKINSILEKQLSTLTPQGITKSLQQISVKSIDQQQQNQQIVQQLLLFDQIKQNIIELQHQNQQQIMIFQNEFERMKKYRVYYPLGNYTNVINSINRNLKLNFKSTKKRAHIRTWSFIKKLQSFSNQ